VTGGSSLDAAAAEAAVATGVSSSDDAGVDDSATAFEAAAPVLDSLCPGDASACVYGGIVSIGSPAGVAAAQLPDGAAVTLTGGGLAFNASTCDSTGNDCVTGAISP